MSFLKAAPLCLVLAIAGCGAAPPAEPTATPANSRCAQLDPVLLGTLLDAVSVGYSVRNMWYVRSNAYPHTLFASGDLQGPGVEGPNDIGTWAIDLSSGSGTWYEVSPLAGNYGGWIPGSAAGYSMTDDGVAESVQCATSSQESPVPASS